jgi:hypothetical protein
MFQLLKRNITNVISIVDVGDDFGRKIPKCVDHMLDDQQLSEYGCLTPSYLLKQEGWSKDTSQLPDIDVSSIKKYLINSKAQKFTVTSLRHYKLSRAYQHFDANHICNVSFNQLKHSSTFCTIKSSNILTQLYIYKIHHMVLQFVCP